MSAAFPLYLSRVPKQKLPTKPLNYLKLFFQITASKCKTDTVNMPVMTTVCTQIYQRKFQKRILLFDVYFLLAQLNVDEEHDDETGKKLKNKSMYSVVIKMISSSPVPQFYSAKLKNKILHPCVDK